MFDKLSAPFHPSKVSWRVGAMNKDRNKPAGMALAYLDWRDVMERLDEACGPNNWQSECFDAGDGRLAAKIGINVDGEWVWKCDGAGGREADRGLSEMNANKGDFSDALKRAAVQWGVGRYLYDVPAPWVDLDDKKRIKADQQNKLDRALGGATPKAKDTKQDQNLLSMQDSRIAMEAMTIAINAAPTLDELEAWSSSPNNVNTKRSLQPAHFDQLKAAYTEKYRALKSDQRVAA